MKRQETELQTEKGTWSALASLGETVPETLLFLYNPQEHNFQHLISETPALPSPLMIYALC